MRTIYAETTAMLYQASQAAMPTIFHQMLKCLELYGLLLRVYSQNIDGLELRVGLQDWLSLQEENEEPRNGSGSVALLHGTLSNLVCSTKPRVHMDSIDTHIQELESGHLPTCGLCLTAEQSSRLRPRPPGELRPDITLYDDPTTDHRDEEFGRLLALDKGEIDCLIVVGTSLRVKGVQDMVKNFSRVTSTDRAFYIALEPPPSQVKSYFGSWIRTTADSFAGSIIDLLCNVDS